MSSGGARPTISDLMPDLPATHLPWPSDTLERWRVLRAFVGACLGTSLGDVVPATYSSPRMALVDAVGDSLRQWVALLDELEALTTEHVFRDDMNLQHVRGVFVAVIMQGEGDYAWTIHQSVLEDDDPPVIAFVKDEEKYAFLPEAGTRTRGPYGSYPRLSDCVRAYVTAYLGADAGESRSGRWETQLASPVSAASLLPEGWDLQLGDEVRDAVFMNFQMHSLDDVTDHEPLGVAWGIDDDELQSYVADALIQVASDLECAFDLDLDPKGNALRTRAEILEFVSRRLAEQNFP